MIRYLAIAISTNKIHRVYWHQLIANGYGLTGENENYPQLTAFKNFANLIKNEKYISHDFSTNLHQVEFKKFIIYWNISNEKSKINFEENRRIMKLDGTENILKHLEINHEPVYIFK